MSNKKKASDQKRMQFITTNAFTAAAAYEGHQWAKQELQKLAITAGFPVDKTDLLAYFRKQWNEYSLKR